MSCARSDELKSGANAERGVTERQGGGRGSKWPDPDCYKLEHQILSSSYIQHYFR